MPPFTRHIPVIASAAAVFDPATLALTGWWRANSTTGYTSGTWNGVASAGGSGSRNLTEATNPPATGTTINSHTAPDFDGVNDKLTSGATLANLVGAAGTAWSIWVLFYADTAPADPGAATRYQQPQFFTDQTNAYLHYGLTSNGVHISADAGTTYVQVAASTGAWTLTQAKLSGGTLSMRVNSGARSTVASGAPGSLTPVCNVGCNYAATAFYDGRIAEIGIIDSALTNTDEDNVKSYINSRYGLSL